MKALMKAAMLGLAIGPLAACGGGDAAARGPSDAPSVEAVKQAIVGMYGGNPSQIQVSKVEIMRGRNASLVDARDYSVELGQRIYPAHVVYALVNGIYIRDYDTHYILSQKYGRVVMSNDSVPGDKNGDLRP